MSYDNAEPKVLKTLNSDGQVLDDAGNVINDTSDYWVQLYNQTEPKVDKILKSDGTVVDAAGNLIQDTTEFNVQKYNQAEPIPAKYLHADGTIDENPGSGSGANLQDNKQVDITSNGEVEITPDTNYDGMKKVTANVSVSSAPTQFYLWSRGSGGANDDNKALSFNVAPENAEGYNQAYQFGINGTLQLGKVPSVESQGYTYEKVNDTTFRLIYGGGLGYYEYSLISGEEYNIIAVL